MTCLSSMQVRHAALVAALLGVGHASAMAHPGGGDHREGVGIRCTSNDDMVLDDKIVRGPGDGIIASDNCTLIINRGSIDVGGTGLIVTGNATVKLRGTIVRGRQAAARVLDNGTIEGQGQLVGRVLRRDNATVNLGRLTPAMLRRSVVVRDAPPPPRTRVVVQGSAPGVRVIERHGRGRVVETAVERGHEHVRVRAPGSRVEVNDQDERIKVRAPGTRIDVDDRPGGGVHIKSGGTVIHTTDDD